MTADDLVKVFRKQIEGLRAAGYDHTEVLGSPEVVILNKASALYRSAVSRRRADATEMQRFQVTYLLVDTAFGLRIGALAVHSA